MDFRLWSGYFNGVCCLQQGGGRTIISYYYRGGTIKLKMVSIPNVPASLLRRTELKIHSPSNLYYYGLSFRYAYYYPHFADINSMSERYVSPNSIKEGEHFSFSSQMASFARIIIVRRRNKGCRKCTHNATVKIYCNSWGDAPNKNDIKCRCRTCWGQPR